MQLENQLRTEIEFWQDVIDSQDEETQDDILMRMTMAKSLAESKLSLLLNGDHTAIN